MACYLLQGVNRVTSYRAELEGVHRALKQIEYKKLEPEQITQYCDNQQRVFRSMEGIDTPTEMMGPDADRVLAIQQLKRKLNFPIECKHVYGHQDERGRRDTPEDTILGEEGGRLQGTTVRTAGGKDERDHEGERAMDEMRGMGKDDDTESTTSMEDSDGESLVGEPKGEINEPYHITEQEDERDTDKKGEGRKGLTDEAQMNIICDEVAGETTKAMLEGGAPPDAIVLEPPYEGSKAMLKAGGRWVTSRYKQETYWAHRLDPMKAYCREKYGMTDEIFNSIHWESVGSIRSRLSQTRFMQTAKIMHGWLPIGHMQKHVTAHATCLACGHPDETIQYMMRCPAAKMRRKREEVLKGALERGIKKRILRRVMEAFCRVLKHEMGDTERVVSKIADDSVRRAVKAQQDI